MTDAVHYLTVCRCRIITAKVHS